MSLISLSCPNCGGVVQYDPLSLGGRCGYCGHWLENSEPSQRAKELLRQYNGCKTTGDMSGARARARDMQSEEPGDFRSWWAEYVLDVSHDNGKIEYLESFPAYTEHLNKMARICKAEPTTWKEETLRGEIAALKRDCNEVSRAKGEAIRNLLPLEREMNSLKEELAGKQRELSKYDSEWDGNAGSTMFFIAAFIWLVVTIFIFFYDGPFSFWKIIGIPLYAIFAIPPSLVFVVIILPIAAVFVRRRCRAKESAIQGIISSLEFDLELTQDAFNAGRARIPFDLQCETIEDLMTYLENKEKELGKAIRSTEQILG